MMNCRLILGIALLAASLAVSGTSQANPAQAEIFPGEILVKFAQQISPQEAGGLISTGLAAVDALFKATPLTSLKRDLPGVEEGNPFGLDRVWSVKLNPNADLSPLIEALMVLPQVEYAEPRYLRYPVRDRMPVTGKGTDGTDEVPNDPLYGQQWALPNIQAAQAWDITHGSTSVKIAIVDLGTQLDHPDLQANIWQNAVELAGAAGVDDDGNGYIDDFYGWDFMDQDGYPNPNPGDHHGTHTAGSASAVTNNGVGIAGVGWSCKIMAVRAGEGSYVYYGMEGITYASLTGADVISCSWGGAVGSQFEQDVINDATDRGSLVVAAAGNESSSAPHYPAAYDHVTSVAATNSSNVKSGYSNYGTWVDCCAPGDAILSTIIGGYYSLYGTSMSCPHVAGLAGLVVTLHPTWLPSQVEAQILSSCDNIDSQNPQYIGLLGAGRINAYRAVTETNSYIAITGQGFEDEDNDGVIEPGESVDFWVELTSLLNAVNNVQVVASTNDPYVTVTQSEANFGNLAMGVPASNQANPFTFDVSASAPGSHQINITLNITGSGGYSGVQHIFFTILPIYGDHNVGNVVLTVTNFGALGFWAYANTPPINLGSGFQYPAGTANALFHGSVLVGTRSNMVSDNCYGNDSNDRYDFIVVPGGDLQIVQPGAQADQEGLAIFDDAGSVPPIGVEVTQRSYSWANSPDDDFVIIRYDVANEWDTTLTNVYVGIYLDWDVNNYSQNSAGWDADSAVGYMKDNTSAYYGLCLVSDPAVSYRVIQNDVYIYPPAVFSDAVKWQFMTEGFIVTQSSGPNDWSIMLAAGPLQIEAGESQTVAFALLGGQDLNDLRANVGQARARWNDLILSAPPEEPPSQPLNFSLGRAYPNPFNPSTTVSYSLPAASLVSLKAYNLGGKAIATLVDGWQAAGIHESRFVAGEKQASGIYLLKLEAGGFVGVQKLVLLK